MLDSANSIYSEVPLLCVLLLIISVLRIFPPCIVLYLAHLRTKYEITLKYRSYPEGDNVKNHAKKKLKDRFVLPNKMLLGQYENILYIGRIEKLM